jgi:hypothetical protein
MKYCSWPTDRSFSCQQVDEFLNHTVRVVNIKLPVKFSKEVLQRQGPLQK